MKIVQTITFENKYNFTSYSAIPLKCIFAIYTGQHFFKLIDIASYIALYHATVGSCQYYLKCCYLIGWDVK